MKAVRKGCCDNSFKSFTLKQNVNFIITQDVAKKKQLVMKTERT